jgi:hypothetical protein
MLINAVVGGEDGRVVRRPVEEDNAVALAPMASQAILHVLPKIGVLEFGTERIVMAAPTGVARSFQDVEGWRWSRGIRGEVGRAVDGASC